MTRSGECRTQRSDWTHGMAREVTKGGRVRGGNESAGRALYLRKVMAEAARSGRRGLVYGSDQLTQQLGKWDAK